MKLLPVFVALLLLPASIGTSSQRLSLGGISPETTSKEGLGGVKGTGLSRSELRKVRGHIYAGKRITRGRYEATAYGPPWNAMQGSGITSTGISLGPRKKRYLVAVDPSVIAYGRLVRIWPNPFRWRGPFVAADTGGAIQGRRIDFYVWKGRKAQYSWGRRDVRVFSYKRNFG